MSFPRVPQHRQADVRQFVAFAAVGVIGFLVDAGVLYLAIRIGLGLHLGRVLSYLCAVTATWDLNRRFTFKQTAAPASLAQWARFAVSQLGGSAVNLGSYFALIHFSAFVAAHPIIGVAVGSLSGMTLNFIAARMLVFRGRRANPAPSRDFGKPT